MPKTMVALSTDDFLIPVTVLVAAGANADPTSDVVSFAFMPADVTPTLGDFTQGFWLNTGAGYLAGITVGSGPGGVVNPGVGKWYAWIWVQDNPTQPVIQVDTLTII